MTPDCPEVPISSDNPNLKGMTGYSIYSLGWVLCEYLHNYLSYNLLGSLFVLFVGTVGRYILNSLLQVVVVSKNILTDHGLLSQTHVGT